MASHWVSYFLDRFNFNMISQIFWEFFYRIHQFCIIYFFLCFALCIIITVLIKKIGQDPVVVIQFFVLNHGKQKAAPKFGTAKQKC